MDCVRECAELSMQRAVDSVKSTPEYTAKGEVPVWNWPLCVIATQNLFFPQWVMTDARHDSTANAYHSTVVCLSGR